MTIRVFCECGKKFQVKEEFAGKRSKCPACAKVLTIPHVSSSGPSATHKNCPSCQAQMQPKAVLCVNCGLDLRTGKKVAVGDVAPQVASKVNSSRPPVANRLRNVILLGSIGGVTLIGAVVVCILLLRTASFEDAFASDRIPWEPVSNIEIVTHEGNSRHIQSHNFAMKITYDEHGRGSVNKEGIKTYKWGTREATFGVGAVIRITKDYNVSEGSLMAGDEWAWDGKRWSHKKR